MKKTGIYGIILVILMLGLMSMTATAEGTVAHIGENAFSDLTTAVAAAEPGDTITIDVADGSVETVELPYGVSAEFAGETFCDLSYRVNESICIAVQKENGAVVLFLPSCATAVNALTGEHFEGIPSSATFSVTNGTATVLWNVGNVTLKKTFTVMHSANISALFISGLMKEDTEEPANIDWLNESKNNVGVNGTATKIAQDGTVQTSTQVKKMKGRGNTSWNIKSTGNTQTIKKPFNLNLNSKEALVNGAGKYKKWALVANNYVDFSGISNYIGTMLYEEIGGNAAVHMEPVDLYVDGTYRGLYSIFDRVEIGKGRINVPEAKYNTESGAVEQNKRIIVNDYESHFVTGQGISTEWRNAMASAKRASKDDDDILSAGLLAYGYAAEQTQETLGGGCVIEVNLQYTTECGYFVTAHGVPISLKEPERPTRDQVRAVALYMQEFEDALYSDSGYNSSGKHYTDYLDLGSFAKTYLLSCFTGQNDLLIASDFFYIDPYYEDGRISGGKLMGGPAWDYNYCYYNIDTLYYKRSALYNGMQAWVEQLLTRGDFVDVLRRLQQGSFSDAIQTISGKIDTYGERLNDSMKMDQIMWKRATNSTVRQYNTVKTNYADRTAVWEQIWNGSALMGVTASAEQETGILTASADGAETYQWYRVDENNGYQPVIIDGATEATYAPDRTGTYYVKVTGTALAGTDAEQMISNPVEIQIAEPSEAPSVQGEVQGEKQASKSSRYPNAFFYEFVTPNIPGEVTGLTATLRIDGMGSFQGDVKQVNMLGITNTALKIASIIQNITQDQEDVPITTSYVLEYSVGGVSRTLEWTRTDSLR